MVKPIIGIVGRFNNETKSKSFVYEEYRLAIIKAGGIPILLLPIYENDMANISPFFPDNTKYQNITHHMVHLCDGILFPGGSSWYGFEQEIYRYAYQKDIPMLGICLGMQMIGCAPYFNNQNSDHTILVDSPCIHKTNSNYAHTISILGGKLKEIFKTGLISVNSRHTSCLQANDSFFITAVSLDKVIEAIEIPNKTFIIGVQWHPESNYDTDEYSQLLFQEFISVCHKKTAN